MRIRGPLGLWPFPLLNFLLELIEVMKQQSMEEKESRPRKRIYQLVRDEKGRIIEIVEVEA